MDKKLNGFNNGRDTTDGVGGKPVPDDSELTEEERLLFKKRGIEVRKYFAVVYADNKDVLAIFKHEVEANQYKDRYCITAIIEPYEMIVK